jgi:exodeoxyribonuclease V alpha subunit
LAGRAHGPGGEDSYRIDIGYVTNVEPEDGELTARFDDPLVTYSFGELDTLVPAYAATIQKSQGSEYPGVVIPVLTQHYPTLQRNLLYTGVTRGKKLVVLVGGKIAIAVRNASIDTAGQERTNAHLRFGSSNPRRPNDQEHG